MSLEECKRLAEKKRTLERQALTIIDGKPVKVVLKRSRFRWIPLHTVRVIAYGEVSTELFFQRESAERYFEKLTQEYGLEEVKQSE